MADDVDCSPMRMNGNEKEELDRVKNEEGEESDGGKNGIVEETDGLKNGSGDGSAGMKNGDGSDEDGEEPDVLKNEGGNVLKSEEGNGVKKEDEERMEEEVVIRDDKEDIEDAKNDDEVCEEKEDGVVMEEEQGDAKEEEERMEEKSSEDGYESDNEERKDGTSRIVMVEEDMEEGIAPSLTFYPTMEQIKNFPRMIEMIEKDTNAGSRCGVIKIVPPKEWRPRQKGYDDIGEMKITGPVKESFIVHDSKTKSFTKMMERYKKVSTWSDLKKYSKAKKIFPLSDSKDRKAIDAETWSLVGDEGANCPLYGADSEGTLYDDNVECLNIARLGDILDKNTPIPGVTTCYMYFGMYRSMFTWHTEDVDLYSINYLHFGEPKHWWSVPPEAADLFERLLSQIFPEDAARCPAFARHKHHLIHPSTLTKFGIPYATTTQRVREFIITFPRGYHMGYNTGLNIAESSNFASTRWINFGMNYNKCKCSKEGVSLNVDDYALQYKDHNFYNTIVNRENGDFAFGERREAAKKRGKIYDLKLFSKALQSKYNTIFYDESQYNMLKSKHFPHCAVCETFLPEELCTYKGEIPARSRRIVTNNMFAKRKMEGYDMVPEIVNGEKKTEVRPEMDPHEDDVIVCSHCNMSVHATCYSRKERTEEEKKMPFRCQRCTQKDELIRTTTCALCELRGGSYVRGVLGSTSVYVHIVCAISHRRAFFYSPTETVYIQPPPKYLPSNEAMPGVLYSSLADPEYFDYDMMVDTINFRMTCRICNKSGEGLLVCRECVLDKEEQPEVAHGTCAKAVGMRIEKRSFPHIVTLQCHRHFDLETRLAVGSEVEVEGEGKEKKRGRVIGYKDEEKDDDGADRSIVKYEEGRCSRNLPNASIISCWCAQCDKKTHQMDAPVVTLWEDKMLYPAYYRGPSPPQYYKIRLDTGKTVTVWYEYVTPSISLSAPPKKRSKK